MYNKYLDIHLDRVDRELNGKSILIYKGFPCSFVQSIAHHFHSDKYWIHLLSDGVIHLEKLLSEGKALAREIVASDNEVIVLPIEMALELSSHMNLDLTDRSLLLVDNYLFKSYPNPTNSALADIGSFDETSREEVDQPFMKYYSYAESGGVSGMVEYLEVPSDSAVIRTIDLSPKIVLQVAESRDEAQLTFGTADLEYERLLLDIYSGRKIESKTITIDPELITDFELKQLSHLVELFSINGIGLNFTLKSKARHTYQRNELKDLLLKYWHSNEYRTLKIYENPSVGNSTVEISQADVIEMVIQQVEAAQISNTYRDVFLTSPTGSGKSVLFQIPAIYLSERYNLVTIVISPLIALMNDQIDGLRQRGVENVAVISSEISLVERAEIIERVKSGEVSILYMSPELLLSYSVNHFIGERKLGLLVVDEAHLVTTWGRDFRVDYWFLGGYIRKLRKFLGYNFPIMAVTATAVYGGEDDLAFQTMDSLNMRIRQVYIGRSRRDDIIFDVKKVVTEGNYDKARISRTVEYVTACVHKKVKAVVYFPWTKQVDEVFGAVELGFQGKVCRYYGGMTKESKRESTQRFFSGECSVMLATKAFGMGVDISDIQEVYHHAPSGNLSDYIQEVGRVARRSDIIGKAKIDFDPKDLRYTKILFGLSAIRQYHTTKILRKLLDLYEMNDDKRNFLVSTCDFGYIFQGSSESIEQKVKSGLLLVENDLLNKYRYNVLIVRPKSLFTKTFIRIKLEDSSRFEQSFGRYITAIKTNQEDRRFKWGTAEVVLKAKKNPVLRLDLSLLWEERYSHISFPKLKYLYYKNELFEEFKDSLTPQICFRVFLKTDGKDTSHQLKLVFRVLELAFNELQGHYFVANQLTDALHKNGLTHPQAIRYTDIILSLFSTAMIASSVRGAELGDEFCFLQAKREGDSYTYKLFRNSFYHIQKQFERQFTRMFGEKDKEFIDYMDADMSKSKLYYNVAYLLDALEFGTFKVEGGVDPQLFIRINDPRKIKNLLKVGYHNNIVTDIENRYANSVKLMETFFLRDMEIEERWDFIEDYFLGKLDFSSQQEEL